MTRRYDDPIEVELEEVRPEGLRPVAFWWRGRRYAVEGLLKYWREAGEGWDPQRARDHECFRVEAEGGVYDLRFDRLAHPDVSRGAGPDARSDRKGTAEQWRLTRVWD